MSTVLTPVATGAELGYAERLTNFTTANTAGGDTSAGSIVGGLSVTVIGQGRPVDVEVYAAAAYHSVANTMVSLYTVVNGAALTSDTQIASISSPSTSNGPSILLKRRLVLTAGTSYTFTVGAWGAAAGTSTLVAAGFAAMSLAVTGR